MSTVILHFSKIFVDKVSKLVYYINAAGGDNMNERIKQVRQTVGLTQSAFATALGLSRNYIAMIEIGQRDPSDRTIADICRVYNVVTYEQLRSVYIFTLQKTK